MTASQESLGCAIRLHFTQILVLHFGQVTTPLFLFTLITTEQRGFGHHRRLGFF